MAKQTLNGKIKLQLTLVSNVLDTGSLFRLEGKQINKANT